jgi:hypothetical protein
MGRTLSLETRDKIRRAKQQLKGIPKNYKNLEQWRTNQALAKNKTYVFINPDGQKKTIVGLKQFCLTNNLSSGHMASVYSGKRKSHKGWKKA